jgi:hypothetical protein
VGTSDGLSIENSTIKEGLAALILIGVDLDEGEDSGAA